MNELCSKDAILQAAATFVAASYTPEEAVEMAYYLSDLVSKHADAGSLSTRCGPIGDPEWMNLKEKKIEAYASELSGQEPEWIPVERDQTGLLSECAVRALRRRKQLGISQQQLAKESGMTLGQVRKMEHCKYLPTDEQLQAVAITLDINPGALKRR